MKVPESLTREESKRASMLAVKLMNTLMEEEHSGVRWGALGAFLQVYLVEVEMQARAAVIRELAGPVEGDEADKMH